ncbi:MAG: glucosamine-6-phosphate deaminase [Candidatus Aminicenantes bacterium]|nr:glucosamine-6-phosphate deaminase [Candidatus Aminicenantes bacterium]
MNILIFSDEQQLTEAAVQLILQAYERKPNLVLGLAAGRTPRRLYSDLVRAYQEKKIDFSLVRVFALDEFRGLSPNHPLSFAYYFKENLFNHINLRPENIFLLNGQTEKIDDHCRFYESMILQTGGIDIQILGIGLNGHIGFNEPGSSFGSRTRLQILTPETRANQQALFQAQGEDPPTMALTMGLATILEARNIILLATGEDKAAIISQALEGPITISLPASCLQLHPSVFVFLDELAASQLKRKAFYLYCQEINKREKLPIVIL